MAVSGEEGDGSNWDRNPLHRPASMPLTVVVLVFVGLCVILALAALLWGRRSLRISRQVAIPAKKSVSPNSSLGFKDTTAHGKGMIRAAELNGMIQCNMSSEHRSASENESMEEEKKVVTEDMHILQMLPSLPMIQPFKPTMAHSTFSPEVCLTPCSGWSECLAVFLCLAAFLAQSHFLLYGHIYVFVHGASVVQ